MSASKIIGQAIEIQYAESDAWNELREILATVRNSAENAMENVTVALLCDGD